jgi:adenylate cyclase
VIFNRIGFRIEASTKAYGTDLLVSEETCKRIQSSFILEQAGSAKVKGKSEPLKLFKVNGYIQNGQSIIVQTPYSSYESEDSEKIHKEPA